MSQTYSKDSFDRFGDDLCQHLLSYLSFEDRFRLECLSKQFQSLIFITQTDLLLDWGLKDKLLDTTDETINMTAFECILRKCQNIDYIELEFYEVTDQMIDLIHKYCIHLQCMAVIDLGLFNEQTVAKLDKQMVQKLVFKAEDHSPVPKTVKQSLKSYTSITSFESMYCSDIHLKNLLSGDPNDVWFEKLRTFSCFYQNQESKAFEKFVDIYKNQLKSFSVLIFDECTDTAVHTLMIGVSQMSQLIHLDLCFWDIIPLIQQHLPLISLKCPQLKSLCIVAGGARDLLSTVNQHFKRLKRLEIRGYFADEMELSSDSLNECKQLTHFSYSNEFVKSEFSLDSFLVNIDTNLPRLEKLEFFHANITQVALKWVSKLRQLQCIRINGNAQHVTQEWVDELFATTCSPKLKHFYSNTL